MSNIDGSIIDGSIGNRVRQALAITALLLVILVCPRPGHADADSDQIAAMIAKVSPAVVRVMTVRPPGSPDAPPPDPKEAASSDRTTMALGSGYIIDPTGFIGTNRHVVAGAISVFVVTADGVRYPAQIVGMPSHADIALLRIYAGHPLPYVQFGDSDKVRVGDQVIAIGSPFGLDNSVTSGIVSALNRDIMESPFDDYIQTDAAINHGNSGGPLFNVAGEVIGMNSVIYAPTPGFAGIAFAVPSNSLRFVYGRLMKRGEIDAGMLPIHTQQVTWMLQQALSAPDLQGALVTSVQDDDGKMLQGKISPGDIIRTFNGEPVWDPRDLARKAAMAPAGSKAVLGLYRAGETSSVEVTIHAWPDAKPVVLNDDAARTLGLELAPGKDDKGRSIVTVASVDANGTAAASGIQKGDVIVQVQQTPVSEPDEALRILWAQSLQKHSFAAVLVVHDKQLLWISIAIPD
ncbi:MAG: trypsin-like peptidase domain-containing protein [Acetobacteraceae bacterium]